MPGQRSIKLCLILFIIGMLISPSYSAPVVVAQEQPPAQNLHIGWAHPLPPQTQIALPAGIEEPLPHDCDGITPPGQPAPACCLYGYVFYAQKPLPGAIVQIASPHGSIIVTTTVGGASSEPYYGVNLSAPPLSVIPGETMTITASYGAMTSMRAWAVQNGGQQVDLGLVANYRMATPVGAAPAVAPDLSPIQPAGIRPMAFGGAPFGSGMAIVTSADGARAVYAADVDRDGDLDVLSASADDHTIAWHENNGSSPPILTTHIITTTASGARSVYAADVNGDGRMDVLSASANDDTIAWYENLGGSPPAFAGHIVATTADGASAVYAVDLDRDGDMDILAASANDDTIAWYENDGGVLPAFTARIIANTADGASSVYAADVNGDGRIDVLSASANDDTIAWYENDGGAPLTFTAHTIASVADGASSVYAADVNGDGNMDILSASANDNTIAWYESGGGSTPTFTTHVVTAAASGAASVYAVDVDRDGDMDILSASTNDDRVVWYENDGGASPAFTGHVVAAADGASSVYAADLDGDGDTDILSASANDNRIAWYPNLSIHRSASFPVQSVITDTAQAARSVYAADLDGDGDVDVLSASYYNQIVWYENQGGFPPTFAGHIIASVTGGSDFATVYAADVDGDGDVDVLSASSGNDRIAWYENMGGSPLTFTGHIITSTANGAASVFAADLDQDGDMDVLSASHDDNTIAWYENGGGSPPVFVGHIITNTAGGAVSVYAADVDGDGDADILSAARYSDTIAWHENLGGSPPTFIDHIITTSADDARQVYAADVDQDGDIDVLSVSHTGNKIAWYENDGGSPPSFVAHTLTTGAKAPRSVYVADLDHDGDMDILSASRDDDRIAWYENIGDSPLTFITHTITTQADAAWSVYAADLDNDGDVDVLSASNSDNKIAWYENQGGQFSLAAADTAPFTILPGQQDDLLRIVAAHRGRVGDLDAEWLMLKLRFEDVLGNPLTAAQANALIKTLFVYRDTGSGSFEPISDTLVTTIDTLALVTGTQVISFAGDPNARIAFGAPVTYFVAVEPADDQIQQTPDQFQMILVSDLENGSVSDNIARYWDYDLPLSPETSPNVAIGLFTSPRIYVPEIAIPFGNSADRTWDVAWADADLDGDLDLAVGSYGPNQMCWNNGDGSFTCEEPFGNGMTVSIAWGDMNRDGWPDLVVGSASGRPNQVCLNNQDRTFTCTSFSVCTGNTCYVAVGDLNGDGYPDIALLQQLDLDLIYFNDGTGITFPITTTTCRDRMAFNVDLGDVDNDGDLDLIAVGQVLDDVCINDGTGHFAERHRIAWRSTETRSWSVALGDVDDDGDLDIVIGENDKNQNAVYLNAGGIQGGTIGYFTATLPILFGPAWDTTRGLALGDVDGDGDLDIVTGNDYEETVVYLNELMTDTYSITFVRAGHLEIISRDTFAVALADMDGDGDLDLAEGRDSGQERVYINLGRLNAAFTASPLTGTVPLNVEFADLSTGSIVAWTWDFGDGGTSGARHPAHVYQDAGLYTVSLTVSGIGGADTETKTGYVNVLSAGSYPPVASINFIWYASAPGPAIQGQDLVYFNGSGYDADEGGSRIVAWLWSSNRDGPLSAQEDFSIEAAALSTGTHTIAFKVQDDEGDWSPEVTRTLTVQAPPPLEIRTLILVNYDRLAGLYGPSEAEQVSTTLHTLATHAAVSGQVIQVENDPAVAAAYAAWDADLLSSVKANAVAEAIRALIVSRWESSPYLEYLVLVGDDRVIPFRRVPDRTREPESHYTAVSASTTVGAALRDDMVLTDDYYADVLPNPPGGSGGPNLYIPDLGIGRLVETPAQMVSQINAFLASSEIVVDSAAVSGYDFVKDSAQAMWNELQRQGITGDRLIGEGWGKTEFTALVLNTYHDVALINGHANHYLIGTPLGTINASTVALSSISHTGAIWGNVGCHAGLNVPPEDAHALDLVEAVVGLKALYVANTGFGLGYRDSIGLSEQLMLNLAERLARGQSATVGQALVAAKHRYYLDDKGIDAYDEKILIENVLYGLPMYRYIVSGGLPLPPPVEEEESGSTSEGGLIVIQRSFVFSPCTRIDTADGAYYALDGQVHAQEGEPLQPGYTADILLPKAAAHGLIFRGGSYADIRPFDPVIAQAMTETTSSTEPVYTTANWGPARFYALNRLRQRDGLSMLLGQYNPHRQTERLYSQQDFDVYYHTHSDDWTAPSISSVSYAWQAAGVAVTVAASDASGIYAVAVAYTSENGVWESVYLQNDGQAWSGSLPIRGSTEFFVQVVDKAGNVAVDDNGGAYYGVWLAYLPLTLKGYR